MEEIKDESMKRFVDYLETDEAIQEYFVSTRRFIEKGCGINLSNIEATGLRLITQKVLKETVELERKALSSGKESLSRIDPGNEILARFFLEFYNLSPKNLEDLYTQNDETIFQEYFRRKQSSSHFL